MDCKTGAEHLASLRDGRALYIEGARVADVTTHPSYRKTRPVGGRAQLF